jgi:hypothetical protein
LLLCDWQDQLLIEENMQKVSTSFIKAAAVGAFAAIMSATASAALYTSNYGSVVTSGGNPSNCDDCFAGAFSLGGTINYFGTTYSDFFIGSNGYITFGIGATNFTTSPLNTQTIAPMIAGSYTDLDSRNDALSNVWLNTDTPGEVVITWDQLGHYNLNYSVRSTFQIVLRTDAFAALNASNQVGFFYGTVTDGLNTSAGFGDGLAAINPGEVAFHSVAPGTGLAASAGGNGSVWYSLNGGTPQAVPAPLPLGLLALGALGFAAVRRRK